MKYILLILVMVFSSGCAAFKDMDWARIGGEVAKISVAAVASQNEDFAEAMEKNNISMADVTDAIDGSVAAMKGDWDKALETSLGALERRIPGTPDGPPIPEGGDRDLYGIIALGVLYAGNQLRKKMKSIDGGGNGGTAE